jgi:hypothetical protein
MTDLSIIIPAYNEAAALRAGKLARVTEWRATCPLGVELLVVDDGSHDETAELAGAVADRVLRIPHAGKAAAIVAGMRAAQGDIVLFSDMDQATPISEASRLLDVVAGSGGLAIGSRGLVRRGAPVGRYVLSWGQVALRWLLIGLYMADTQCGFKAMPRAAALRVLEHLRLYGPERLGTISGPSVTSGFDVEFLFVARRLGYRITEVPVAWDYQATRRVNLLRDAWRGVQDLVRIRLTAWRGEYPSR